MPALHIRWGILYAFECPHVYIVSACMPSCVRYSLNICVVHLVSVRMSEKIRVYKHPPEKRAEWARIARNQRAKRRAKKLLEQSTCDEK